MPKAPPHNEPDNRDRTTTGPTRESERALRARLTATGVYRSHMDTGGPMPTGRATKPSGKGVKAR